MLYISCSCAFTYSNMNFSLLLNRGDKTLGERTAIESMSMVPTWGCTMSGNCQNILIKIIILILNNCRNNLLTEKPTGRQNADGHDLGAEDARVSHLGGQHLGEQEFRAQAAIW
jgi:hypothetical protein